MESIFTRSQNKDVSTENEKIRLAVLKGATWLTASKILIYAYTFFVHIYVVSLLSPEEYALVGIGLLVIRMTDFVYEFGLGVSIIQKKNITKQELNSIFWFILIIGTILFFILCASASSIESFFGKKGVKSIILVLAWGLLLKSFGVVPSKLLERKLKFKFKAFIDLTSKFLSLSSAGIFAFLGFGIWSLIYAQVIHAIFIVFFSFYFERFIPELSLSYKFIKQSFAFGINIVALRITWYFRNNVDKIISGKILNSLNFGYYSLSFNLIATMVDTVKGVLSTISLPLLSKANNDTKDINATYLNIVKYASLITFPIFIGGSVLSREIIYTLLPAKWAPASTIFIIVCFLQIFRIMSSTNEDLFVSIGKPNISFLYNLISLIPLSLSIFIGIQWGIVGLLTALLIIIPILNITWIFITLKYRKIKFRSYFVNIRPAIIGTTVMFFVVYLLKICILNEEISRFLMGWLLMGIVLAGGISYFIVIYFYDKNIIKSLYFKTLERD